MRIAEWILERSTYKTRADTPTRPPESIPLNRLLRNPVGACPEKPCPRVTHPEQEQRPDPLTRASRSEHAQSWLRSTPHSGRVLLPKPGLPFWVHEEVRGVQIDPLGGRVGGGAFG